MPSIPDVAKPRLLGCSDNHHQVTFAGTPLATAGLKSPAIDTGCSKVDPRQEAIEQGKNDGALGMGMDLGVNADVLRDYIDHNRARYAPLIQGAFIYISTDAGQPLTSVLERSTYVPALDKAAYNGGDDFLGSARERLFGFINGQTGADNKESQGFVHLVKDGHASEDASAGNTALIDALRNGGDLLNVFGDFPTLSDPRHAQAYSPLWDAQLGLWTNKAVQEGLNKRQIDEVQVFNLAATRPDLLTGVNPATGQPAPYGASGVDINCAVIGFTDKAPTANLADPVPNSQFPPR